MHITPAFTDNISQMLQKRIADGNLVLPVLPDVVVTAEKMLQDKDYDTNKVSALIERDPVLAAQVLALANSAAFARQQRADSIRQAIAFLGAANLRKLLLTATSRRLFSSRVPQVSDTLKTLWHHSLAVAVYSQDVAGLTHASEPEAAYVAGLLHDVGQAVVAVFLVEVERSIVSRQTKASEKWISLEDWIGIIKTIHRPISVAIAEKWNLPQSVAEAIQKCDDYDPAARNSIANIVKFSGALAEQNGLAIGEVDTAQNTALLMIGRSLLGLDEEVVNRLSSLGQSVLSKSI
jgi:putative nucleotidyltransferase with HDIG domain